MNRQRVSRRLALLVVALGLLPWAGDVGLAQLSDRAANGATPATAADKAVTATTVEAAAPEAAAGAAAQGGKAKGTRDQAYVQKFKKIAPSVQKEAAKQARLLGLKPGIAGLAGPGALAAQAPDPGGIPHYFGPYANWAFSPLPKGPVATVTVVDGGTGYTSPLVTVDDAYLPTTAFTPAVVSAQVAGGVITGFTITDPGAGYMAPVVTITDGTGTGALADAIIGGTLTGGMQKFVDYLPGIPGVTSYNTGTGYNLDGSNLLGQYIPAGVAEPCTHSGQMADCYQIALVEYSEQMHSGLPATKLRGYVQIYTPGSTPPASAVLLSGVSYKGQAVYGYDRPHYLGPVIVANGKVQGIPNTRPGDPGYPKPVRIKFYNLLPSSLAGGNLLLPVDETVPGAGVGPAIPGAAGDKYPQNRATIHLHGNNTVWISDGNTHQWITPADEVTPYPKGVSVRNVPDMTETLPDGSTAVQCDAANSGCMTFFYTNAQSARLQFYHDHAHGITRLNVYAGEAAGYVVTDAVEQDMINGTNFSGVNISDPTTGTFKKVLPDIGIPLVIQDKTWVDPETLYAQDPTWNWGSTPGTAVAGDFWYPHVYMVVSNPYDPTGANPFGRWFYGPWFNPPTPVCVNGRPVGCIEIGLVPNEYAGTAPWEPPLRPGVPNPSVPGESFMDTPIVNGTAYPVLKVEPKAYRFRILSAANDRALNLQLYVAADKTGPTTAGSDYATTPARLCDGSVAVGNCTEVKMVPVSVAPANQFADTPSGIPDPTTKGPNWWQIGTEGGFMPAPVVVPQQPIGFNMNTGQFNFGIVNQHSLFLMPAERADVVVDFSAYAGKTLILYNDSPAPIPAGAAVYDFYTGDGNQMDGGGAPNTQPGYGPNTRTIMQIQVAASGGSTPDVTLANLQAVFAKTATKRGVFEVSQDPILIPQAAYNSAYNLTFPSDSSQFVLSPGDVEKTFQPLGYDGVANAWSLQPAVSIPFEMKAMHDEMGGVYDTMFGRMSGMLGLTNPNSALGFILPFPFSSPPTDVVKGALESTKIGELADGTQLWRIFHNGVDTHPIHTHLFTAQVISRVGQDGQVASGALAVDPNDLGWKDTFKVNPLEIAFLALRPTVPTPSQLPFEQPNSVRLIDPTLPEGATLPPPGPAGWFDPNGNPIPEILNHYVNFGWEYVWHCHILSHEEMDFMHSLVFAVPPKAPTGLAASFPTTGATRVILTWTDNSTQETQFTIQRATNSTFTSGPTTFVVVSPTPNTTGARTYTDSTVARGTKYWYRVVANGQVVGDVAQAGFPTMSADSLATCVAGTGFTCELPSSTSISIVTGTAPTSVAAPSNLTATPQAGPQVSLTWRDNATNETGFVVERCTAVPAVPPATGFVCSGAFAQIASPGPRNNTGNVTYVDTTVAWGTSYFYRVAAFNAGATSSYVTLANPVVVPAIPDAPTNFTVSAVKASGNNYTATLNWAEALNPANFTIQRANNLDFTRGLTSFTAASTARSLTQTVTRNTVYYYRIRANNNLGGSSAWTNASPFPIRTGP